MWPVETVEYAYQSTIFSNVSNELFNDEKVEI